MFNIDPKIAICSTGPSSSSPIDERFGRCAWFLIWDPGTRQFETLANDGAESAHGAGTGSVQALMKRGVGIVISQRVGPKAFDALTHAGVKVFTGVARKTVEEALSSYQKGELIQLWSANN